VTALPSRRRNRTLAAALSGVLVLGAAPTLGYFGYKVIANSKEGTAAKTLPVVGFPSTPTAMLAVVDDQQLVTSLNVLILAPAVGDTHTNRGGTIVTFPTDASIAQTAEEQQVPIADSVINGGAEALQGDAESLARVSIGTSAVLDQAALTSLLSGVPAPTVELPADVVDAAPDGTKTTVFPAGSRQVSAAEAASILVAADPNQPEVQRLPNVRAVWSGVAAAVGQGVNPDAVGPFGTDGPTDFSDFMAHFLAGPIQVYDDFTTVPITGPTNPNNVDVGALDVPSVVMVMAQLAPSAMITPKPTLNFRIENGITQADIDAGGLVGVTPVQVTLDLVQRLLFAEGNIVSVSPEVATLATKTTPDKTTVFAENGVQSDELSVITKQLGQVDIQEPKFQYPLVNVIIVIGRSYLADMVERQAAFATSTSGAVAPTDTGSDSGAGEGSVTSTVSS
jgi:hypothetical protein